LYALRRLTVTWLLQNTSRRKCLCNVLLQHIFCARKNASYFSLSRGELCPAGSVEVLAQKTSVIARTLCEIIIELVENYIINKTIIGKIIL
jgi:hypothetical protein